MVSSSLHCQKLVEWGRRNELVGSMVGAKILRNLWILRQCNVEEQRCANVKLATGLLPVDFTMFFFHSVHSKKSLLIVKLGSFQNASIEIKQISFVYEQNRFTVIVVLIITDFILEFVKVGLVYISNIYIR